VRSACRALRDGQPHCFDTKLFEMHGIKGPGLWIEQMFLAQQQQVPVGVSMDATRWSATCPITAKRKCCSAQLSVYTGGSQVVLEYKA
jgi:hypothetical protein